MLIKAKAQTKKHFTYYRYNCWGSSQTNTYS